MGGIKSSGNFICQGNINILFILSEVSSLRKPRNALLPSLRPPLCSKCCLHNDLIDLTPGSTQHVPCTTTAVTWPLSSVECDRSVVPSACPGFFACTQWLWRSMYQTCSGHHLKHLPARQTRGLLPWGTELGQVWRGAVYRKASSSVGSQKAMESRIIHMTVTS